MMSPEASLSGTNFNFDSDTFQFQSLLFGWLGSLVMLAHLQWVLDSFYSLVSNHTDWELFRHFCLQVTTYRVAQK